MGRPYAVDPDDPAALEWLKSWCARTAKRRSLAFDEVLSAASPTYLSACQCFKPELGNKFSTYLWRSLDRVQNRILNPPKARACAMDPGALMSMPAPTTTHTDTGAQDEDVDRVFDEIASGVDDEFSVRVWSDVDRERGAVSLSIAITDSQDVSVATINVAKGARFYRQKRAYRKLWRMLTNAFDATETSLHDLGLEARRGRKAARH